MDAFRQVLRADVADEVLVDFERDAPQLLTAVPADERCRRVAAAIERGRRDGLAELGELVGYAACLLCYGRGIDRHSVVRGLLAQGAPTPDARWCRQRAGPATFMLCRDLVQVCPVANFIPAPNTGCAIAPARRSCGRGHRRW